jgi:hypothetical protein
MLVLLAACNANDMRPRCTTAKDCTETFTCIFDVEDGCGGQGHCVKRQPKSAASCPEVACGCDGQPAFRTADCQGFDRPIVSTSKCP